MAVKLGRSVECCVIMCVCVCQIDQKVSAKAASRNVCHPTSECHLVYNILVYVITFTHKLSRSTQEVSRKSARVISLNVCHIASGNHLVYVIKIASYNVYHITSGCRLVYDVVCVNII